MALVIVILQCVRLATHGGWCETRPVARPRPRCSLAIALNGSAIVSNGAVCPCCEPAPRRPGREAGSNAHQEQRVAAGGRDSVNFTLKVCVTLGAEPELCGVADCLRVRAGVAYQCPDHFVDRPWGAGRVSTDQLQAFHLEAGLTGGQIHLGAS